MNVPPGMQSRPIVFKNDDEISCFLRENAYVAAVYDVPGCV